MKRPEPKDFWVNNNIDIDWIDYSHAQDKYINQLEKQVTRHEVDAKTQISIINLLKERLIAIKL